ncbi:hypothetical protein E5288_WYG019697 [Bos mutus]|uniref:Uncharacterized protein n=1 Tax=Bos mutus TaxID=72004 RepID=A0A6B0RV81_9CETA|nr:hypothetical protein [Bos mutus]
MARARSAGAAALSHSGPGPPKQGLVRRLELSRSPAGCHGGASSLWLPGSRNVHRNMARLPHFCPEPSPGNPRFQGKLSCKQHTQNDASTLTQVIRSLGLGFSRGSPYPELRARPARHQ